MVGEWSKPILVFSLSLAQAEQFNNEILSIELPKLLILLCVSYADDYQLLPLSSEKILLFLLCALQVFYDPHLASGVFMACGVSFANFVFIQLLEIKFVNIEGNFPVAFILNYQ